MSLIQIRKRILSVETIHHEGGPAPAVPLRMVAAGAVVRNPYAGRYEPDRERLILLGGNVPGGRSPRINGKHVPDTLRLKAGERYRLRLIHIIPDWTARIALLRGDSVLSWRALAKDGAEPWPMSPDEFRAHITKEIPRWKKVVDAAKITVE